MPEDGCTCSSLWVQELTGTVCDIGRRWDEISTFHVMVEAMF
jgi:hypothetical protein